MCYNILCCDSVIAVKYGWMDLWLHAEVTPICYCDFFSFFYKNYYRSVKLDGRGSGHLWRMWVLTKTKRFLLIFQSQSYVPLILRSPWLKVVFVCVLCICKRTRNGRCVRRVHAHFFVFSYEPPSILPTYTRYRLSVPLFFYDYVVLHCYGVPVCVNCTCVR